LVPGCSCGFRRNGLATQSAQSVRRDRSTAGEWNHGRVSACRQARRIALILSPQALLCTISRPNPPCFSAPKALQSYQLCTILPTFFLHPQQEYFGQDLHRRFDILWSSDIAHNILWYLYLTPVNSLGTVAGTKVFLQPGEPVQRKSRAASHSRAIGHS
jgi:hypothetical protein